MIKAILSLIITIALICGFYYLGHYINVKNEDKSNLVLDFITGLGFSMLFGGLLCMAALVWYGIYKLIK
jgi:phosphatidylglycerophosphatase A